MRTQDQDSLCTMWTKKCSYFCPSSPCLSGKVLWPSPGTQAVLIAVKLMQIEYWGQLTRSNSSFSSFLPFMLQSFPMLFLARDPDQDSLCSMLTKKCSHICPTWIHLRIHLSSEILWPSPRTIAALTAVEMNPIYYWHQFTWSISSFTLLLPFMLQSCPMLFLARDPDQDSLCSMWTKKCFHFCLSSPCFSSEILRPSPRTKAA